MGKQKKGGMSVEEAVEGILADQEILYYTEESGLPVSGKEKAKATRAVLTFDDAEEQAYVKEALEALNLNVVELSGTLAVYGNRQVRTLLRHMEPELLPEKRPNKAAEPDVANMMRHLRSLSERSPPG